MTPFSDPRFPGDAKASHFQLVLRRRPDGKLPELEPGVVEELSQIIAYLEALRANIKDAKSGPILLPDLPHRRPPHSLNLHAFRAKTIDSKQEANSLPPLTLPRERDYQTKKREAAVERMGSRLVKEYSLSDEEALPDHALLTDSKLSADDPVPSEAKTEEPAKPPALAHAPQRAARWKFALAGAAVLAASVAAILLRRPVVAPREEHPAATAPATAEAISAEASKTADFVLRSILRGRLDDASRLLADARKNGLALPGLRYQAGLLALRQSDVNASTDWLEQSVDAGEFVPECLYLRAYSAAINGDYATACGKLEEASGHAAFSPRYFFFWAEALRRYGHPAQALPQFERALLCRPDAPDAELIRFKMKLAQVETGSDEKFQARLQAALALPAVSGDVLLVAAAVEINRGTYPAAAQYLQQAKQVMPPAVLATRLRDFFFQSQARQPELAAVWPVTAPARPADPAAPARSNVIVIDPATRNLTEADPAMW